MLVFKFWLSWYYTSMYLLNNDSLEVLNMSVYEKIEDAIQSVTGVFVDGKSVIDDLMDAVGVVGSVEGWITGRDDKTVSYSYDIESTITHDEELDVYKSVVSVHQISITPRCTESAFYKAGFPMNAPIYIPVEFEIEE